MPGISYIAVVVSNPYSDSFFSDIEEARQHPDVQESLRQIRRTGSKPPVLLHAESVDDLARALHVMPVQAVLIASGQHRGTKADAFDWCQAYGVPVYLYGQHVSHPVIVSSANDMLPLIARLHQDIATQPRERLIAVPTATHAGSS